MALEQQPLNRRQFLRIGAAATAAVPLTLALASCSQGGSSASGAADKTAQNPFGLKDDSKIEAVLFNGGFGIQQTINAAKDVEKKFKGVKAKVSPTENPAQELQPRFAAGDPPDLINNSGANAIPFSLILKSLSTFDDLMEADNYEGKKISTTLYPGVKKQGSFPGKFVVMPYVMYIYGLWYSDSLFKENDWSAPKTFDEAMDLGAKAKAKGKYLFVWGKEAATYYLTFALDSAIKAGGLDVMHAVNNLKPKAWSQKPIQDVFKALERIVKAGYFLPGGAGMQFTAAQAKWSNDQAALLYPSGGWIENEMKKATKDGFDMVMAPEPTVGTDLAMPFTAMHAAPNQNYIVPSTAKNPAGGKEILRAMLSKDVASDFSKSSAAPTIVKGVVPDDAFGFSGLASQLKALDTAGSDVFDYEFITLYGLNTDQLVIWNDFLSGSASVSDLTTQLQKISDDAAAAS
jgi:N-acetylglucosamine transport system substrate-binding protein